ncbi:Uncharacterised protein r2_g4314 [Pycnogonum litorale]
MTSDDHLALSSIIKNVHKDLRKSVKAAGRNIDDVWDEHKRDKVTREIYAKSMKQLATTIWEKNNEQTRIDWVFHFARFYYREGRLAAIIQKENRKLSRLGREVPIRLGLTCVIRGLLQNQPRW